MDLLLYIGLGLLWSVVYNYLIVDTGDEPLTLFQAVITVIFWPVVLIFFILSYLTHLFYDRF